MRDTLKSDAMEAANKTTPLPPKLLARVQAAAAEEHRPTNEIVQEAVERYLESRHSGSDSSGLSAGTAGKGHAAAAQIRELRKGNILPEGVTIDDLISEGRA